MRAASDPVRAALAQFRGNARHYRAWLNDHRREKALAEMTRDVTTRALMWEGAVRILAHAIKKRDEDVRAQRRLDRQRKRKP